MSSKSPVVHHIPVLLDRVRTYARGHERIVDCTAGDGGHLQAFLDLGATVLAVDRDPTAIRNLQDRFDDPVSLHNLAFGSNRALEVIEEFDPDFIFMDLGVSSAQIDEHERGFTFRPGAPLDMRMDHGGETAAQFLARATREQLEFVLRTYGDERRSRKLAAEIVRRRANAPMVSSDDLVNAIRAALGPRTGPAEFARIFQAFRIAVNDERTQLEESLPRLRDALQAGGRLVVITYHSGEDRIVKHQFREWASLCVCPPGLPVCQCRGRALGQVETRRPVTPDASEVAANPRSRSAKLRVFRKAS